jgi:hypothetical protein
VPVIFPRSLIGVFCCWLCFVMLFSVEMIYGDSDGVLMTEEEAEILEYFDILEDWHLLSDEMDFILIDEDGIFLDEE